MVRALQLSEQSSLGRLKMSIRVFLLAIIVTLMNFIQTRVTAQEYVVKPTEGVYGNGTFFIQSKPAYTEHVRSFVQKIVLKPLDRGAKPTIGWLDLRKLSEEIEEIEVYYNTSNEVIVGSGARVGAVNLTEKKAVVFNSALMDHIYMTQGHGGVFSSIGVEAVMLHETLGALGYPDDNYEISTHLYMRSMPQDYGAEIIGLSEKAVESFLIKEGGRRTQNTTFRIGNGGSTGVGGGGDPVSAALKLSTLSMMFKNRENLIGDVIRDEQEFNAVVALIHSIKVEPQSSKTPYNIQGPIGSLYDAIRVEGSASLIFVDTNLAFVVASPRQVTSVGIRFLQACLEVLRKKDRER